MMARTSVVDAIYRPTGVAHYGGNPLIEALPPIMDLHTATTVLSHYVSIESCELEAPTQVRSHCVGRLYSLVQASPLYIAMQRSFDELIRGGYVGRNPLDTTVQRHLYSIREIETLTPPSWLKATSGVLSLTGPSGIGKSTMIERILACYPRVIQHKQYAGEKFVHPQVVWLKISCPHDGSLTQLCLAFFVALDSALGTSYAKVYTTGRHGVPGLLAAMRQLCATYSVGVLVIDELQHLSLAKVGGKRKMMNFFVNLVNDVGVPLMLIGTYGATSLFQEAMRDARRASGDGMKDFCRPVQTDRWWDLLVETAWDRQWTRERIPLTPETKLLLYDLSQGITDILIKLLVLAQRRALRGPRERITEADFRYVADHDLVLLRPAVAALRKGSARALEQYEDLLPTNEEIARHLAALDQACANTAEEVMSALRTRAVSQRVRVDGSQDEPADPNSQQSLDEELAASIRQAGSINSLLSVPVGDDVHAGLRACGLVVESAVEQSQGIDVDCPAARSKKPPR
ncbi:ATP-binding protein [Paraburkholderia sp. RL17-337-BIB-A]|uniref:ATP-binding protein n=1 Tax=Paraburkholderia sp. RL17-337-BIB-A TaxID=3031636 RepID=UPI0038B7D332